MFVLFLFFFFVFRCCLVLCCCAFCGFSEVCRFCLEFFGVFLLFSTKSLQWVSGFFCGPSIKTCKEKRPELSIAVLASRS